MVKGTVVCLGEILIDQVVDVNGNKQNFPGGAPANVAAALARFHSDTEFIGGISYDTHGQNLIALLAQMGVGCRGIQQLQHPTRIVEVLCDDVGDRTFGGFLGGNSTSFADTHLAADILPMSLLEEATALVVGTLGLAYPETREAMIRVADVIQSQGGQMIVDVNWRPTFWAEPNTAIAVIEPWLKRADWLKLSVEDAKDLLGMIALADLKERFPRAKGILLTDGERGCGYYIAEKYGKMPAFSVTSIDTTGAGDAFLAGFIYQLFRQKWTMASTEFWDNIVTFASAVGALTTLKTGAIAAQPSLNEIYAFLEEHTHEPWTI